VSHAQHVVRGEGLSLAELSSRLSEPVQPVDSVWANRAREEPMRHLSMLAVMAGFLVSGCSGR
ncbi:MAG: hypothetical protein NTU94_05465, partial [Planctomycetota bacterium]|nr:hypothetical protein [Planctomycetota bacterium]